MKDDDTYELPLDPIWRQAAQEAISEFKYGDIIPREWLIDNLRITEPQHKITVAEYQRMSFDMLTKIDGFKDEMLTRHQRYLINIRGIGYKIIEPPHQTNAAMTKMQNDLRKTISSALKAVINIDEAALSLEDARANAEARAKIGAFATLHIKKLGNGQEAQT